MTGQVAKVTVRAPDSPTCIVRVRDLPENCCFEKESMVYIKQENGYCLSLNNFVRYQVRPTERVDAVYKTVRMVVE